MSASWAVPTTAVSGIYMARVMRDDTGGASMIYFVVRDDESASTILFQTSDSTWEAYNNWDGTGNGKTFFGPGGTYGGVSLYTYNGNDPTLAAYGRATEVSYNRPLVVDATGGGFGDYNSPLHSEYPMVRWLEANGYDVSYTTDVDTDRNGTLMLNHQVFLSVGHDEYWSAEQRDNVQAAATPASTSPSSAATRSTGRPAGRTASTAPPRRIAPSSATRSRIPTRRLTRWTRPNWVWTGTWRDVNGSLPADGDRPRTR